jgi:hypothetical protein
VPPLLTGSGLGRVCLGCQASVPTLLRHHRLTLGEERRQLPQDAEDEEEQARLKSPTRGYEA